MAKKLGALTSGVLCWGVMLTSMFVAGSCLGQVGCGSPEADAAVSLSAERKPRGEVRGGEGAREKAGSQARLLIADDHHLMRSGIRLMLEGEPDLVVVGEAENGREALELSRLRKPDLVLMDVEMPVMNGLAAIRALKEESPGVSVLVVTSHESQEYLLEAIRAGAAGYVLKTAPREGFLGAVRGVLAGELPFGGDLAARLLKRLAEETAQRPESAASREPTSNTEAKGALGGLLTPREIEVLRLIAAGKTNREVAGELVVSLSTVKTHVQRIISKLGVSDRTQAAVKAVEMGLHD